MLHVCRKTKMAGQFGCSPAAAAAAAQLKAAEKIMMKSVCITRSQAAALLKIALAQHTKADRKNM